MSKVDAGRGTSHFCQRGVAAAETPMEFGHEAIAGTYQFPQTEWSLKLTESR